MGSRDMNRVDEQAELSLTRRAEPNEVAVEMVHRQRTSAAALCLACQSSGLEDKEIYQSLGIDAGYWSRIKKGEATLQADLIESFCQIVNNCIYPEWIAYRVGCTLVQIKSEAERRAELAEQRAREAEAENKLLRSLVQGRAVA